jgi:hypothetical protein
MSENCGEEVGVALDDVEQARVDLRNAERAV